MTSKFLLASDFDQTLSFNDSGVVLSELIGFHGFHDKVKGLADINLVQQGAELSYLILHDPDFRRVRREHLVETGKAPSVSAAFNDAMEARIQRERRQRRLWKEAAERADPAKVARMMAHVDAQAAALPER